MKPEITEQAASATEGAPPRSKARDDSSPVVVAQARRLFKWARRNSALKIIPAVERELVVLALKETGGNQTRAATLLGVTRATLRKRIERFGIQSELRIT
jgi:two-component system nitrogen regulation response regulator GlnG